MDDELREGRLTRPDGRVVAWTEWGPPDGLPVLRIPGTPGSRFTVRADTTPWRDRGLRMITTERPGFGASTRLPGRGFAEHADDLVALLDTLGIERVRVIGGSGGAPHLLCLAARHPQRVSAATVLVGAAPLTDDEVEQMIGVNLDAHRLIRLGDLEGLRELLAGLRDALLADPLAGFRGIMADAPPADQAVIGDPRWQSAFVRATAEALRPGVDGWLDEALAIQGEWRDVAPEAVRCSVTWWHGDADRNAPLAAAQRLVDRLADARLQVWPDAGHLTAYHHEGQVLDDLLARG